MSELRKITHLSLNSIVICHCENEKEDEKDEKDGKGIEKETLIV